MALSMCLAGETLMVVEIITAADFLSYDKVKLGILEQFRYTPVGFGEQFTGLKPDPSSNCKDVNHPLRTPVSGMFFQSW